jgi:acetolactate synthase I/II/III large subunit
MGTLEDPAVHDDVVATEQDGTGAPVEVIGTADAEVDLTGADDAAQPAEEAAEPIAEGAVPIAAGAEPIEHVAEPATVTASAGAPTEPGRDSEASPSAESPEIEPASAEPPDAEQTLDATPAEAWPESLSERAPVIDDSAPVGEPAPVALPEPAPVALPEPAPVAMPEEPPEPSVPPEPQTVAAVVAAALHSAGARWAFTVPGESFLGLLEALKEVGIRVVATRHEAAAGFMAEAVGQLTSRPAIVLATRAVGGANLSIAVHTARQDSTPLIALLGQVARADRGREAFQEAELTATVGGYAKWSAEPHAAADVPSVVGEGLTRALTGRPGPVVLSFPEDLLDEEVPGDARPAHSRPPAPRADPDDVAAVLRMLAAAERPVILAGAGVLRARCSNDLVRLIELIRVPVIASWRRGDVVPNDHPLYLGMTGYGAPRAVRERLEAADALLVLGCRLNEVTSYGYAVPRPGLRWAHVDLEPRVAATHGLPRPDLAVASDARVFIRSAIERLQGVALDAETTDRRMSWNDEDRTRWEASVVVDQGEWAGPGVHPGRVVATLRRLLPDEAIVTTDAGNFAGWLARGFRLRRPGTFLGPTSGAMGYGLPAAIAAALVHRDRPVVAWTGDGGFAMTMPELETAVRERLRLVAIVLDNERYGMIRMHQERRGDDATATDLGPIDFATVARGLGADGVRVERDEEFEPALAAALASERPTVLHLVLDRGWVSVDEHP